jgi:hypothetical protein
VGRGRIELPQPKARVLQTLGLTTCPTDPRNGGDEGTRTPGLRDANAALSQLSYIPTGASPEQVGRPAGECSTRRGPSLDSRGCRGGASPIDVAPGEVRLVAARRRLAAPATPRRIAAPALRAGYASRAWYRPARGRGGGGARAPVRCRCQTATGYASPEYSARSAAHTTLVGRTRRADRRRELDCTRLARMWRERLG